MAVTNTGRTAWHVDKKVTIGHLIATASCLMAVTIYITDVNKRLDILQSEVNRRQEVMRAEVNGQIHVMQQQQLHTNQRLDQLYTEINRSLARIEQKIDSKVDKIK